MTRILIVDDEIVNLMIMQDTLESAGYTIDQAEDGEEAWQMMQEQTYEAVVLDRIMPRLNGLDLLRRIKAEPRWATLPVIMQTAADKQQEILEGLEAGAYYYLTKPYEPRVLRMLVGTVVAELTEKAKLREAGADLQNTLLLFERGELRFRTIDQARHIAAALSPLCRTETSTDTGLMELLVNAIEHGNLGITYADKSRLRMEGQWEAEVERRLTLTPWSERQARLAFHRDGDIIEFAIIDEGAGFDWKPYMNFDPDRAFDLHGRGIAMANMLSFASVEYRGSGNTVIARAQAA